MDKNFIRNFSIIAHIDHGKSTLADRIIEYVGAVDKRNIREQMLDDMELERERGITIKASAVRLEYKSDDGNNYILNLIDTPGHVDFTYEVSKSLSACEGALLVVDASQGIEAQTIANFYLALEQDLVIIPVINKIDLPSANINRVKGQLVNILGFKEEDIICASSKEGIATKEILERTIQEIPTPKGDLDAPLKALVFDSRFDVYKGVIVYVRVFEGAVFNNLNIKLMQSGNVYKVEELGVSKDLNMTNVESLSCGEVGYFMANIRNPNEIMIGDTVTAQDRPALEPLPGYKEVKPLVFCGIYPVNAKDFDVLRSALEKFKLSDASFVYEPETSVSFGFGFRSGFLGLLHMEIVQERLEREYDLNLVLTTPNVVYRVKLKDGSMQEVDNPAGMSPQQDIATAYEPFVEVLMMVPTDAIESVCNLAKSRRGIHTSTEYLGIDRVKLIYQMPLSEIIVDFYDRIKSLTKGYGSIDYEFREYRETKLAKLDILLNGVLCDAFSSLIFKDKAQERGRRLTKKLAELIPRQLFPVAVQAAVGSQIIASEKIRALGKHVTGKCYGGDITRKRKLWEKQKMGKKRLKQFGRVQIPQEAFLEALKIN